LTGIRIVEGDRRAKPSGELAENTWLSHRRLPELYASTKRKSGLF